MKALESSSPNTIRKSSYDLDLSVVFVEGAQRAGGVGLAQLTDFLYPYFTTSWKETI